MSCFAYMPGLYTLDYWHEKYKGHVGHKRFLLTKLIEVVSFKLGYKSQPSIELGGRPPLPTLKTHNSVPDDPIVCVVVPCFVRTSKDQKVLERLQASLMQQHLLADVVLVDDASPLPVQPIFGEQVVRLKENAGPAAARNIGKNIALKRGADVIVFTDMDCVTEPGWLSALCDSLILNPTSHVVSGKTKSLGASWLDRYHNMNGTLNGRLYEGREKLLYGTTCNLALTEEVARKIEFNESFPLAAGEDIEFCFRVNQAGYNIQYVEAAIVAHDYFYNTDSLIGCWKCFIRQFRKYAKGEKLLLEMAPDYYAYYAHSEGISVSE